MYRVQVNTATVCDGDDKRDFVSSVNTRIEL